MHIEFRSLEYRDATSDGNVFNRGWVFQIEDRWGHILKFNARWVVQGFKQQEGLDCLDTFASIKIL